MEVNGLAGAAPLPPRNERLSAPESQQTADTRPTTENAAPENQPAEQTAQSPAPSTVPASTETTDLNQLLLRNTASTETAQAPTSPPAPTPQELAQEGIEEQNRTQEQRNQLQDRFDAISNDGPSPNIDVSA